MVYDIAIKNPQQSGFFSLTLFYKWANDHYTGKNSSKQTIRMKSLHFDYKKFDFNLVFMGTNISLTLTVVRSTMEEKSQKSLCLFNRSLCYENWWLKEVSTSDDESEDKNELN